MLFSSPALVIVLKRSELELYLSSKHEPIPLEFSTDAVENIDLVSKEKYEALIKNFLAQQKLKKQKVVILLSDEVLFAKALPPTNAKETEDSFLARVPFTSLSTLHMNYNNSDFLMATNKELVDATKDAFTTLGFEIVGVMPLGVVLEDPTNPLFTQKDAKKLASNVSSFQKYNFS